MVFLTNSNFQLSFFSLSHVLISASILFSLLFSILSYPFLFTFNTYLIYLPLIYMILTWLIFNCSFLEKSQDTEEYLPWSVVVDRWSTCLWLFEVDTSLTLPYRYVTTHAYRSHAYINIKPTLSPIFVTLCFAPTAQQHSFCCEYFIHIISLCNECLSFLVLS